MNRFLLSVIITLAPVLNAQQGQMLTISQKISPVGAIALISHSAKYDSAPGPTTSAINTTGATLEVCIIGGYSGAWTTGSGTTGPITDSLSNTWNYLTPQADGFGAGQIQIAYSFGVNAGASQTFTLTTTIFQGSIACSAYSGTFTTSSVFTIGKQNGAATLNGIPVSSLSTGTVTPAGTGYLYVSGWSQGIANDNSGQANTSLIALDSVSGANSALSDSYLIFSGSSALAETWTQTNAGNEEVVIAVFNHP